MSYTRLLTRDEIDWIYSTVIPHTQHMPCKRSEELTQYINTAIRENEKGELLNHEDDPWTDGLTLRHGANSVIGTLIEYLVLQNLTERTTWNVELTSDRSLQERGVDLLAHTPSEALINISVKKLCEREDGYIRFGQDYFPKHSPVDIIAFYDMARDTIHYQSYESCKDIYRAYDKVVTPSGTYIYRQKEWLLSLTEFDWTITR